MSKLAGVAMGLIPFAGTGLQAFTDAQRSIDLGVDPLTAYSIAGTRGVVGGVMDVFGPGWLKKIKNTTDIVGSAAVYGGMAADAAGQKGLASTLSQTADMLNPDKYVKDFMYKMFPGSDPDELERKKRETELALERAAAAERDLNSTKSTALSQVPPTGKDSARAAIAGDPTPPAYEYVGRLPITVDESNIDSMIASAPTLSRELTSRNMRLNWVR